MTYSEATILGQGTHFEKQMEAADSFAVRGSQADLIGRHDAALLLSHVTGANLTEIAVNPTRLLNRKEEDSYLKLIGERRRHIPLQYLLGRWQFMGLDFIVDPRVLIPRQDTETLVEAAVQLNPRRVLDLCTGSGCIGISLAKLTEAEVVASDISKDALAVARQNAELNGVSSRVRFVHSDLFGSIPNEKFDLIVSNPPYIPSPEIPLLQEEVKDHEPLSALDGGEDGLDFYRRIVRRAGGFLEPEGALYFEAGPAGGIRKLLEEYGYKNITTLKDLAGKERVICGNKIGG